LLEKCARYIHVRTKKVAEQFPGKLWRIYGPEFASEPYLPPRLFDEYVVRYTGPMVKMIQEHGGYARLHCHGRIKNILDYIIKMGADAIDPIEPPPNGDVDLDFVRQEYGKDLVLFGNIEISDIETIAPEKFKKIVRKSLEDGMLGQGSGFVLMPSACPYSRKISERTLRNYETMVELTHKCK
jgi:uroporphyrinogen-III decarboxylase